MPESRPGPLAGVRVVDLTIWIQGPVASALLADLGADVIKVERAGSGDLTRNILTAFGSHMALPGGGNLLWSLFNRNKRTLALDLRQPEARPVFERLVRWGDVLITNIAPDALRSIGADRDSVHAINPDIIYARGAGLGERGPRAEEPCMDTLGMAYSGMMFTVSPSADEPHYPPGALADMLSGTNLALGVMAALLERRQADAPSRPYLSSSQLQSLLWLQTVNVGAAASLPEPIVSAHRSQPAIATFNTYRCGDGRWLALGIGDSQEYQWRSFCEAIGRPGLPDDARFADIETRRDNASLLASILDQQFARRPADEWLAELKGRGLWASVINRLEDVLDDPQVVENGYVRRDSEGIAFVPAPVYFEGYEGRADAAPAHGAHSAAVLEELGFGEDEAAALRVSGAVW